MAATQTALSACPAFAMAMGLRQRSRTSIGASTTGSYRSRPSSPAGLTMCADPTKPGDPTNPARKQARPGQRAPSRRHDEPFRLTRSMTRLPSLLGFRTFRLAINCTQFGMVGVRSRPQMHSDRPALCGARRSAHTSDAMHNGGSARVLPDTSITQRGGGQGTDAPSCRTPRSGAQPPAGAPAAR